VLFRSAPWRSDFFRGAERIPPTADFPVRIFAFPRREFCKGNFRTVFADEKSSRQRGRIFSLAVRASAFSGSERPAVKSSSDEEKASAIPCYLDAPCGFCFFPSSLNIASKRSI